MAQRDELLETMYITEPEKLRELLRDSTTAVHSLDIVSPKVLLATVSKDSRWVEPNAFHNPIMASFVTAHARRVLGRELTALGQNVVYYDTGI